MRPLPGPRMRGPETQATAHARPRPKHHDAHAAPEHRGACANLQTGRHADRHTPVPSPPRSVGSAAVGNTCYLCEMGTSAVLPSSLAAGEGFGTCYDCAVHACPRHGERTAQFFRCADCIAADATRTALLGSTADPDAVGAAAPRLSVSSAPVRARFQFAPMREALISVRNRLFAGEPLSIADAVASAVAGSTQDPAGLLALPSDSDRDAAAENALARATLWEAQLHMAGERAGSDREFPLNRATELATAGLAIAYDGRGIEDPELSPLGFRGGLTLPAPVVVVGHAYAEMNRYSR